MILITGGTGLLGSRLIYDLIKSGENIRALKRPSGNIDTLQSLMNYYSPQKNLPGSIEWVDGDISDIYSLSEAMNGIKKVYHCAAMVSFQTHDHEEMMKINVEGTANIVNACIESGVEKLCYSSSVAVFGRAPDGNQINEQTPWNDGRKRHGYAISKYLAEQEVWRGTEEGLKAVIVNPSVIIGPGNWGKSSSSMFKTVWNGLKFYTSGATGFVDVRDVSKSMIMLMNSAVINERFIVSSENITYRKAFDMIADNIGKKKPYIKATPLMAEIGWRIEKLKSLFTGKNSLITQQTAKEAFNKRIFSNKKIKEVVGIGFIPIEKAVQETAGIFLSTLVVSRK